MALKDAILKAAAEVKRKQAAGGGGGGGAPVNAAALANPSAGVMPAAAQQGIISSRRQKKKPITRGSKLAQPGGAGMLPPPVAKPVGSGVAQNTVPTMAGKVAAPIAPAPQAKTRGSRPKQPGY